MVSEEEMQRAEARARLVTSVQRLEACQIAVVTLCAELIGAGHDTSRLLDSPFRETCRACTEDRGKPVGLCCTEKGAADASLRGLSAVGQHFVLREFSSVWELALQGAGAPKLTPAHMADKPELEHRSWSRGKAPAVRSKDEARAYQPRAVT